MAMAMKEIDVNGSVLSVKAGVTALTAVEMIRDMGSLQGGRILENGTRMVLDTEILSELTGRLSFYGGQRVEGWIPWIWRLLFGEGPRDRSRAPIRIPQQRHWSKLECDNLPRFAFECPRERLVAMDDTIQQGLQLVEDGVDGIFRVSPLVIARLYRGGKTTVLKALFERLKEENYLPIIVSLNGVFTVRSGETPLSALIRQIALQFVEVSPGEDATNFVCSHEDLCAYLSQLSELHTKPIVLLVDELNRLGAPLDREVAGFLKKYFLDTAGRYLVFSSHVLMAVDAGEPALNAFMESAASPPSDRFVHTISLPFCLETNKLRKMGAAYGGLTALEVTLGGGIPSLVYIKYQSREISMETRFQLTISQMVDNRTAFLMTRRQLLISSFLCELRDGEWTKSLFSCFADTVLTPDGHVKVRYPLSYVACIWKWLTDDGSVGALINTLSTYAREVGGGKDWEVILVTAMYLRFLHCQYVPVVGMNMRNRGPLGIATDGVASVSVHDIPGELQTIGDALDYLRWRFQSNQTQLAPLSVVIAVPRYNQFPDLDGFILYTDATGQMKTHGYQAKTQRGYPRHDVPEAMDQCFLLRGNAPARAFLKNKWHYVDEATLRDLLGFNLQRFYPSEWARGTETSVEEHDGFD
eukprot:gene6919-4985_t